MPSLSARSIFRKRKLSCLPCSVNNIDSIGEVVLFSDNEETTNLDKAFSEMLGSITKKVGIVRFNSLLDVIKAVNDSTHVITTKLHVGVSAISMGKMVLCLSDTPKSRRFYSSVERISSHNYFYMRNFLNNKKIVENLFNSMKQDDSHNVKYGFYKNAVGGFLCE